MTQHIPRTVTVPVLVTKPLEIEEPDWCTGRHSDQAEYKADLTHYGPEHTLGPEGFGLFRAMLAQTPFTERGPHTVQLYVEQQELNGAYSPDEVEELADALVEAAARLRSLGRELTAILARGDR
ncbi:DUF6907 domain-containing protein [Streptomyces sp. NPDC057838]|uniref:DUF6907 domain-containing protein n=1 Tax=unclassified Streptomyces TaxID=2593676 RepID=UPI0036BCE979